MNVYKPKVIAQLLIMHLIDSAIASTTCLIYLLAIVSIENKL